MPISKTKDRTFGWRSTSRVKRATALSPCASAEADSGDGGVQNRDVVWREVFCKEVGPSGVPVEFGTNPVRNRVA